MMLTWTVTLPVLLGTCFVSFIAGVAFAGAIVWIETRKWRRPFAGINPAGKDDGCTVYGHYDARGVLHIDRVEMDGDPDQFQRVQRAYEAALKETP